VFDAQSTGGYIHRGESVVVVGRSGATLVVESTGVGDTGTEGAARA
jgi:membrane-bound ClpP family serine protease